MLRNALYAGLIALAGTALAGCDLYYGGSHSGSGNGSGGYDYCDSTGCYHCDNSGCTPTGGSGGSQPGDTCTTDADCASGCYCDNGQCAETGFCTTDADCPKGYTCDSRATCVPPGDNGGACTSNSQCPYGSYCDQSSGKCVTSWSCNTDADCGPGYSCDDRGTCVPAPCTSDSQCVAGDYCDQSTGQCTSSSTCDPNTPCPSGQKCDPSRATCVPSGNDVPSCGGTITCTTAPPTCPNGQTPAIQDGCYTGSCITTSNCDVPPPPTACSDIATEAECSSRSDCIPVYTGVDCTNANGGTCKEGDTGCTCASFKYSSCAAAPQ